MSVVTNIADLERRAKKRLPAIVYEYLEGGAYNEETLRRNRADLEALGFVPRVLRDVSQRTTGKIMLGERCSLPLAIAPVGAAGILYPNAEVHAARAAAAAGVPFCLGTLSICTIEEIAEAIDRPFWFQLYFVKDRGVVKELIDRAIAAGCSALLLSMDLHVRSSRYREQKHGLIAPPKVTFANIWDGLVHPRYLLSMIHSRHHTFGNLKSLVPEAKNVFDASCWLEDQWNPSLSIADIEWVRSVWPGKLLIKGVMHPQDAIQCIDVGADGVVVSNHGGRQVGGAVSTVSILPEVAQAVGDRGEVLVDSGIRTGVDILRMIASGATGCLTGRAFYYGISADGEDGGRKALEILATELDETMALCGVNDLDHLPTDLMVNTEAEAVRYGPSNAYFS